MPGCSRELVRLVCDSKLPEPLDGLRSRAFPRNRCEFLADQGFKTLLARLNAGGPAPGRQQRRPNDVMTALEGSRAAPRRPSRSRSTARNMRPSLTTLRSTAGSLRRPRRAMSRSTPRPTASTASSPGWRASALRLAPNKACYIPVGHSGADLYSDAPSQLPLEQVLGEAEAAAGGLRGPQDRP